MTANLTVLEVCEAGVEETIGAGTPPPAAAGAGVRARLGGGVVLRLGSSRYRCATTVSATTSTSPNSSNAWSK